jgi:hypothetical protein
MGWQPALVSAILYRYVDFFANANSKVKYIAVGLAFL